MWYRLRNHCLLIVLIAYGPNAMAVNDIARRNHLTAGQANKPAMPGSQQLEKELQTLTWPQFRSVVEAIPPLKAEVEKYGPAGWEYVRLKYKTHAWRKNIDRLDEAERRQLVQLIRTARKNR